MILIAGAGAMAAAARSMRRTQNQLNRRAANMKARRANRLARARGPQLVGFDAPGHTEFPCVNLCGHCGYFVDETETVSSCPQCSEIAWLDLGHEATADALREIETSDRMQIPTRVKVRAYGIAFGLIAAQILSLGVAGLMVESTFFAYGLSMLGSLLVLFIAIPAIFMALPRASEQLLVGGDQPLYRWHVPIDIPDLASSGEPVSGMVSGETIIAPFSGQACVVYRLGVLFDTPGDARPAQWVLHEQRATSFVLDQLAVEAEQVFLDRPMVRVESLAMTDEQIARFLRQRGLFITDGEFTFYEARLVVDESAHGLRHHNGMVVVVESEQPAITSDTAH